MKIVLNILVVLLSFLPVHLGCFSRLGLGDRRVLKLGDVVHASEVNGVAHTSWCWIWALVPSVACPHKLLGWHFIATCAFGILYFDKLASVGCTCGCRILRIIAEAAALVAALFVDSLWGGTCD